MKKNLLFICSIFYCALSNAQVAGDYRSNGTGMWNNAATWQRFDGVNWVAAFTAPSSSDGIITILNGHTITANTYITADQVVVNVGGTLSKTGEIFTLNDGVGNDLQIDGTLNVVGAGSIIGMGNILINNKANWSDGTISTPITIGLSGTLSLNAQTIYNPKMLGSNLTNTGTINDNAENLNFRNGSIINNNIINANNVTSFTSVEGTNSFTNNGSLVKSGTGTMTIGIPTTNTINGNIMGTGYYNFISTFVNNGKISPGNPPAGLGINGPQPLSVNSTLNIEMAYIGPGPAGDQFLRNNNLTLAGTLNVTELTPLHAGGFPIIIVTGGIITGRFATTNLPPNCTIIYRSTTVDLAVLLPAAGDYRSNGTGTWENAATWQRFNGTAWVDAPSAPSSSDGVISILNGTNVTGSTNITADQVIVNDGGTLTISNGTFTLNDGIGDDLQIYGILTVNGGTISGSGRFNNGGTVTLNTDIILPANIALSSTGTINGASNLTVNGDIFFRDIVGGGSLTVNGNAWWNGGNLGKNFVVQPGGTLNLNSSATKILQSITLYNNGTINLITGTLSFSNSSLINNYVLNLGDFSFVDNGGSNSFTNNGSIVKSGTGTTSIGIPTTNNSTGNIMGTGNYNFTSTFANNGKISPGNLPSMLSINGPQPLSANSTLNFEMLNSGHGRLTRNSSLTLAGTLNVTRLGSLLPGKYVIVDVPWGITGTFAAINLPPGFSISYNPTNVTLSLATVPLKLISFKGRIVDNKIQLDWQTAQEQNTSHFEIQRSSDGQQFTSIGEVIASGNTNTPKSYQFLDEHPLVENNFYRLKMIDNDNSFEYSSVVKVNMHDKPVITVKPNPVTDFIIVEGATQFKEVQILDATGKMVKTMKMNSSGILYMADLKTGMYVLRLINEKEANNLLFMKK